MTTREFSNQFDTLLRSYTTDTSVQLDEYEKSVYLTRAQEAIVKEFYKTVFEADENIRSGLRPLIKTINAVQTNGREDSDQLYSDNYKYSYWEVGDDLWYILYEEATQYDECLSDCFNGKQVNIRVVRVDELANSLKNPFMRPNERRIFRVDQGAEGDTSTLELISKYNVDSYRVRYLRRPHPIILQDLPDNLSINGEKEARTSELNTSMHGEILARAVQMALTMSAANIAPSQEQG